REIGEHVEIIEATVNKNSVISIKKHINYMKELDKPTINKTSIESVEHLDYITEPDPSIVIKSSIESIDYAPKLDKHSVEYIGYAPASDKPIIIKSSIESIDNVPESNEPKLNESKSNEPESNELTISNKTVSNTIGSEARKAKTQNHNSNRRSSTFAICCAYGKVRLQSLSKPPSYLLDLYILTRSNANSFHKNIRSYNNILDKEYLISRFMAKSITTSDITASSDQTQDTNWYGSPTASEVAIIIIGDSHEMEPFSQDILLRLCSGGLQRILEFCSSYDPLHYVLLFPKGNDGWYFDIPLIGAKKRDK
ncbi:1907_t:CDS:2, partial [Acaulospora morrowiae]